MQLKPGMQLRSTADTTELVVVKPVPGDVAVTCGGQPMVGPDGERPEITDTSTGGDGGALGKRYVDEESGLEVLCVKPGRLPLAIDGRALTAKGAKALPSSD